MDTLILTTNDYAAASRRPVARFPHERVGRAANFVCRLLPQIPFYREKILCLPSLQRVLGCVSTLFI